MSLCSDWIDLLKALNDAKVRYLVIGGHAFTLHVEPRYTGDLDLWTEPSPANAQRLWTALQEFGVPLDVVSLADFTNLQTVYQMGTVPNRVDILTDIVGVTFQQAWKARVGAQLGGVPVFILSRSHLIRNKLAAGRDQDLLDVKKLTARSAARRPKRRRR